jgi:hypothetical protein
MFSFRFFIALCLVLMMIENTLSTGENSQQTSNDDQQKKALETQNIANNSSTSTLSIGLSCSHIFCLVFLISTFNCY